MINKSEDKRIGDWILTYTGRQFWPLDPRPDEVCIEDIAHALSMLCRFGGHCSIFYSVAEHSVNTSRIVSQEFAMAALLHDAAEAYVVDIPRPLKRYLSNYSTVEQVVWMSITKRFGIPNELPEEVKQADIAMLKAEASQIMAAHPTAWESYKIAANVKIVGLPPQYAKCLFMDRFIELST